jgi:hypothetical protein
MDLSRSFNCMTFRALPTRELLKSFTLGWSSASQRSIYSSDGDSILPYSFSDRLIHSL